MLDLGKNDLNLLKKCLEKHRPDLVWILTSPSYINIDEKLGNELRSAVGDELTLSGFSGDAPNELGLQLENLIDVIGRFFLYQ